MGKMDSKLPLGRNTKDVGSKLKYAHTKIQIFGESASLAKIQNARISGFSSFSAARPFDLANISS